MTTLYIAGPMTGLPEFNYPAFMQAEKRLVARGYVVLNPARHGYVDGFTWLDYMRLGIRDVTHSDGVALLPGWENSRGATLEKYVADAFGLPVKLETEWIKKAVA